MHRRAGGAYTLRLPRRRVCQHWQILQNVQRRDRNERLPDRVRQARGYLWEMCPFRVALPNAWKGDRTDMVWEMHTDLWWLHVCLRQGTLEQYLRF